MEGSFKPTKEGLSTIQPNYYNMNVDSGFNADSRTTLNRDVYEAKKSKSMNKKKIIIIGVFVGLVAFAVIMVIALRPETQCTVENETTTEPPVAPKPPIATNGEIYPWRSLRLPPYIIPHRYHLEMHPNIDKKAFQGKVEILVECKDDTDFIVINSKDHRITVSTLMDADKKEVDIAELYVYPPWGQIYIQLKTFLRAGMKYTLTLHFTGKLTDEAGGLYITTFRQPDGNETSMVVAKLQAVEARAAFPCFDEPHLKSTFKLSLIRSNRHMSISNSKLTGSSSADGISNDWLMDTFEATPRMSTYLVSFVIGNFSSKSNKTSGGTTVSVFCPETGLGQVDFALSTAVAGLEAMEKYFKTKYPLPKLDLVAIPDFEYELTENWGLLIFKDTAMMFDEKYSSIQTKLDIGLLVVHGLSQQWFGDFVTMRWWSDLWLSVGFARFMEFKILEKIMPDWEVSQLFNREVKFKAMALDILMSSHPVSQPVETAIQITSMFDRISYDKGASLLRMISSYIGESAFQTGIQDYLDKYGEKNADSTELWNALSSAVSKDKRIIVENIMKSWTTQQGYPLVTVNYDPDTPKYSFKQALFVNPSLTVDKDVASGRKRPVEWAIPLTCVTDKDEKIDFILDQGISQNHEISTGTKWVKCNHGHTGYYRVTYDDIIWKNMIQTTLDDPKKISSQDRAGLIDDAFALTMGGELPVSFGMSLIDALNNTDDPLVWLVALDNLRRLKKFTTLLEPTQTYLKEYSKQLINKTYANVGWKDEGSLLKRILRFAVLDYAVEIELKEALQESKKRFLAWRQGKDDTPKDLKIIVIKAGVRYGGEDEFFHCYNIAMNTTVASIKKDMYQAMASTRSPELIQRLLDVLLKEHAVKIHDMVDTVKTVSEHPTGRFIAWRFVRSNWEKLLELMGKTSKMLGRLVAAVTKSFNSHIDEQEMIDFAKNNDLGAGEVFYNQSVEAVAHHMWWLEKNNDRLDEWLKSKLPNTIEFQ